MQIEMAGIILKSLLHQNREAITIFAPFVFVQCWRKKDYQDLTLIGLIAELIGYA